MLFLTLIACILTCSAPLTSFDWNESDPSMVGTSSIDTTSVLHYGNARATAVDRLRGKVVGLSAHFVSRLSVCPSLLCVSCTIWDVNTCQAKTQLIAHDKEVYDIAFAPSTDVFASAGADGSVRMFDLRALEHSTIIYESPELVPLLRLCWSMPHTRSLASNVGQTVHGC